MTATATAAPTTRPAGAGARRSSPLELLPLALALGFGFLGLKPLGDPDVWWHLRTGELIVSSGFTTTDPWSHASTNAWLLHEWAPQVVMYLAFAAGGYAGVVALHALGMLALAGLLLRSLRREASPGAAAFVGAVALVGLLPGSAERPQLVSWCLLAVVLPRLRRYVRERRAPWWLVPTVAVWANVHGMWSVALVLYGFLVGGLVLEVGVRRRQDYQQFLAVGVASAAAVCLTPNGPRLLLAPLHVRAYSRFVVEWDPPDLTSSYGLAALLVLGLVVVGWARSTRRAPLPEVALVVGASLVGLAHVRTVPVLLIALAPLAARALHEMTGAGEVAPVRLGRGARALALVLVGAAVAAAAAWLPVVPVLESGAPWRASATLDALPGRARVLNEYQFGSWLLWTARDTSPAIDGRTEIYDPDYVADVIDAPSMYPGWKSFVADNDFDAAWLYDTSPLVRGLRSTGWRQVYRDDFSVILVPPGRG